MAKRRKASTASIARRRAKGPRAPRAQREDALEREALPALEGLAHVPEYGDLAPTEAQTEAFEAYRAGRGGDTELSMGFVCRFDRNFPAVRTEHGLFRAEHAERIFTDDLARPVVGDWVVVRDAPGHDVGLIEEALPRKSELARWRGSARGRFQVLAANVDLVLVAQPVGRRTFSLDRIVRSAVVAADCGCRVGVILTKADRADDPLELADDVGAVKEVLGRDVPVVALAAGADEGAPLAPVEEAVVGAGALWGVDAVREVVAPGTLALLLGESGAGKSTLLNALLGDSVLEISAVRSADDAGRHTTVARRMVKIPGAGVAIDCPGLRSLPLMGHERGLDEVFPEIVELAGRCRFRDCTHSGEPGCAVEAAVADGEVSRARADAYLALAREMRGHAGSLDPDVRL